MQYTVPDAKVRGRKVRVTCKHCRTPFVIDGTEPAREPLGVPNMDLLLGNDDATRVGTRPDFSVHEEPTVIGQIPAAALEAERRYAQRTLPPPPPASGSAPPSTKAGTAPASRPAPPAAAERVLPPYSSEPTLLIPTPQAAKSSLPPARSPETTPLLADDDLEPVFRPRNKRTTYLLLALTVLIAAVVAVLATR